jgi:hypothetical protein
MAQQYTHTVDYRTVPIAACSEKGGDKPVKHLAYMIDSSGSMEETGGCPTALGTKCSRIDVVRWAMRRVLPARMAWIEQYNTDNPDDRTSLRLR